MATVDVDDPVEVMKRSMSMKKLWMMTALFLFFAPSALAEEFTAMSRFTGQMLACGRTEAPNKGTAKVDAEGRLIKPAAVVEQGE